MTTRAKPAWKGYEALVKRIYETLHKGAVVTADEHLLGKFTKSSRQFDLTIRYSLGGVNLLIVVECKLRSRRTDSPQVASFASAIKEVGANSGFMVSQKGFTKGARNLADVENIRLYTVEDTAKREWLNGIMMPVVFDLWALRPTHLACVFEDGRVEHHTHDEIAVVDTATMQPITADALLRSLWEDVPESEKIDGKDVGGEYILQPPSAGKLQFGFIAQKRRFWRQARLDFLGVVSAHDNEAIVPSLRITTFGNAIPFPTGEIFRDTPSDLAHFGLMIASVMVQSGEVDRDLVLMNAPLIVTATAGPTPLTVKLGPSYSA